MITLSPCAAGREKGKVVDVFKLRKMAVSSRQWREMAQICQIDGKHLEYTRAWFD